MPINIIRDLISLLLDCRYYCCRSHFPADYVNLDRGANNY